MVVNITAVPFSALWNFSGSPGCIDTGRPVIVCRQGQMQILVITVQQFPEIFSSGTDIGAWMIQCRQTMDAKMSGCLRPLDLHQAMAVAVRFSIGIKIGFPARNRQKK